ncbi:MAG: hypothetical protein AB7O97_02695 [Planctomycetota bacterium]
MTDALEWGVLAYLAITLTGSFLTTRRPKHFEGQLRNLRIGLLAMAYGLLALAPFALAHMYLLSETVGDAGRGAAVAALRDWARASGSMQLSLLVILAVQVLVVARVLRGLESFVLRHRLDLDARDQAAIEGRRPDRAGS